MGTTLRYDLEDICWLLIDAVRYSKKVVGHPCLTLESFRFISSPTGEELTSDSMGAFPCDKGKPYFYSRYWESGGYKPDYIKGKLPCLFLVENQASKQRPFELSHGVVRSDITLGIVDKLDEGVEKVNCDPCTGRTIPEIFRDTQKMLEQVLVYISRSSLFLVNGDTYGLWNDDLMEEYLNLGKVSSAVKQFSFGETIASLNASINFERPYYSTDQLFGTQASFIIEYNGCMGYDPEYNVSKYPIQRLNF